MKQSSASPASTGISSEVASIWEYKHAPRRSQISFWCLSMMGNMLPNVLIYCAGPQSWCTKASAEEETLQRVLAVRQGFCHQEFFAPRVPDIHHLDDCLALAWREGGVMEGMACHPLQQFLLISFHTGLSIPTPSNAPVSTLSSPSLTLLTTKTLCISISA